VDGAEHIHVGGRPNPIGNRFQPVAESRVAGLGIGLRERTRGAAPLDVEDCPEAGRSAAGQVDEID
jgi:hypothetical protein